MTELLIKFNVGRKIYALKAIKEVFDLTLREAKDIIEAERGFRVSVEQWLAIMHTYVLSDTSLPDENRAANDWIVQDYDPEPEPQDLSFWNIHNTAALNLPDTDNTGDDPYVAPTYPT